MMTFKEIQRFRQPWLWVLLGLLWLSMTGMFAYGIIRQLIQGIPFGSSPMSDTGLIISAIFTFLLITAIVVLFITARLTTRINNEGIFYRFSPFHREERSIAWEQISDIRIVSYHPIRQFGGWGIRYGKNAIAYNVSGNKGIEITLKNGERILLGTQKAEVMKSVLKVN